MNAHLYYVSDTFESHQRLSEEHLRRIGQSRVCRGSSTTSEIEAREKQVSKLPAVACDFYDHMEPFGWGPTLRELLIGTRFKDSPLQHLRGYEESLVRHIYTYVTSEWSTNVTLTIPAHFIGSASSDFMLRFHHGRAYPKFVERQFISKHKLLLWSSSPSSKTNAGPSHPQKKTKLSSNSNTDNHQLPQQQKQKPPRRQPQGLVAYAPCGNVTFPDPADRNVNMMPFVFGTKASLPEDLQCYYDMIEKCPYSKNEIGKVGYLTIHESYIEANTAQRREGLHIEAPSAIVSEAADTSGETNNNNTASFTPGIEHSWGQGVLFGPDQFEGGIFMTSNMKNTSMVWDALVDKNVKGIVDCHGGCEHLRPLLGRGYALGANELIWMTDCTPHQALVQKTSGYRQFFRIVTSQVSHWYSQHSTRNPLVPLPSNVMEVSSNKFSSKDDTKRKTEICNVEFN